MFEFFLYTVWACLKGVTPYKALEKESTDKNHCDDNYSAPFAMLAPSLFDIILTDKLANAPAACH